MPLQMPGKMFAGPPVKFRPEILGRSGSTIGAPPVQTTIRYVRKTGSDANGGTSPADAWLTINHALQTAAPGTIVYVGAGVYRETVQVTITPTAGLPVSLIGDVGGFFTGDAGMVQLTAYTTNDKTAPSATTLLNLNGKSNLTFQNLVLVGGQTLTVAATTIGSQAITFRDVAFIAGYLCNQSHISFSTSFGTPANWLIDRCYFGPTANATGIAFAPTQGTGGDYDANIVIRNSIFNACGSTQIINFVGAGTGTGLGGGLRIRNCLAYGFARFLNAGNSSALIPCSVYGCVIQGMTGNTLNAAVSGQITEDYNLIASVNARANVSVGAHSKSDGTFAPLWHMGQERVWGGTLRPFGEPMASSPLSNFGSDGLQTPYDLRVGPRPNGAAGNDVGAFQRGNNAQKETVVTNDGSVAISFTGDGFQDYDIAVDAGPLTITALCDYDSSYAGPAPRLMIVENGELGIGQTEINFTTASLNAFGQAQITINPTASGVITVRFISGDTSGVSKVAFDTLAPA